MGRQTRTGRAVVFVEVPADAFSVVPDKMPSTEPRPPLTMAGPHVLHEPVHLPFVLQSTDPPAATQLYPAESLKYTPPAWSQWLLIASADAAHAPSSARRTEATISVPRRQKVGAKGRDGPSGITYAVAAIALQRDNVRKCWVQWHCFHVALSMQFVCS